MKYHIEKNTVQETLVIPLFGRLVCSERFPQLFSDPEAKRICDSLDYDFAEKRKKMESVFGLFGALEVAQRQYDLRYEAEAYLQGHPNMHIPGVDMASGSLGQGISAAVGMALAAKMDKADWRVYTVLGDGEIQEGEVWEAAMLAANHGLNNLVALVDNNNLQIDGAITDVNSPYPIDEKFKAFKWHVINIDGHDFDQIRAAYKEAREVKDRPVCIVAKTVKGKGVSFMENNAGWHGKSTNAEEYKAAMQDLERIGEELCRR